MVSAAAAASVALLASACGKSSPQPGATPSSAGTAPVTASTPTSDRPASAPTPAGPRYAAGTPLISDGSDTVTIGGTPVRFPTKVSEATWSPDGSRVAFVDGSGGGAPRAPDGSGAGGVA